MESNKKPRVEALSPLTDTLTTAVSTILNPLTISSCDLSISNIELGSGGFSQVFLGVWQKKRVAIKKINASPDSRQTWGQFKNEAELQGTLSHPNIIMLLAVYIDASSYCMVQEYAERGSLRTLLTNTNHSLKFISLWWIAHDIASALAYLHEKNIKHNDVKPENILLMANNRGKLTDFGISSAIDFHTKAGTYQYLSSECFFATPAHPLRNEKADIHALGIVMWEMFCGEGKIPFNSFNKNDGKKFIAAGGLETIPLSTPSLYATIIQDCWKKTEERSSAILLMKSIQEVLDNETSQANRKSISSILS